MTSPEELRRIYLARFEESRAYREKVWAVLISDFFQPYLRGRRAILDLGCGYGEFINQVQAAEKYAMDMNPDAARYVAEGVRLFAQDCTQRWPLPDSSLDLVFSSNFFEHLADKSALTCVFAEIFRCLRPGGMLIAMGPNIRYLNGSYWDFWDHHLPLTHLSLGEGLQLCGFEVVRTWDRFLPYTMVGAPKCPLFLLRLYLRLPLFFRLFGQQFLVLARKPELSK